MGAGVIAPMALQCADLEELHAISAKNLFPQVTTWIGFHRERVFRNYMRDFVALFAPHWSPRLIEQAATADSQSIADNIAQGIQIPLRNGCTVGLEVAA
jgi:LysR family cys regulon transcriptional activator